MKSKKRNSTSIKTTKKIMKDLEHIWEFELYVAGQTPETITTLSNLKNMCEKHLNNCYKIKVIDLLKAPHLAKEMQMFAIPTTIKKIPKPPQRLIGDFSNSDDMIYKIGIKKDD
jgi:circadian clock protein KaiB